MGKPGSGILDGNFQWLGSFEQCKSATEVEGTNVSFNTQYCLAPVVTLKSILSPFSELLELLLGTAVVFLHVSVCSPGVVPPHGTRHPPLGPDTPGTTKGVVHILLECFLVITKKIKELYDCVFVCLLICNVMAQT